MVRSEKLIELGNSWFSPKCIEVQPQVFRRGGKATDRLRGPGGLPIPIKLRIPRRESLGVRLRVIRFVVKRETAQIIS